MPEVVQKAPGDQIFKEKDLKPQELSNRGDEFDREDNEQYRANIGYCP